MRLYLDANAIIYSIEGPAHLRQRVYSQIALALGSPAGAVITSRLSRLECRVKPVRDNRQDLLDLYDLFFAAPSLHLIEVGPAVIERATNVRARNKFKTPDAIHLATAIESGVDRFLTGDKDLARCTDVLVEVL